MSFGDFGGTFWTTTLPRPTIQATDDRPQETGRGVLGDGGTRRGPALRRELRAGVLVVFRGISLGRFAFQSNSSILLAAGMADPEWARVYQRSTGLVRRVADTRSKDWVEKLAGHVAVEDLTRHVRPQCAHSVEIKAPGGQCDCKL